MITHEDFTRIKSELLRCDMHQCKELIAQLRAQAKDWDHAASTTDAVTTLWEDLTFIMKKQFSVYLPRLAHVRKSQPWIADRLNEVSTQVEQMLDREFKTYAKQERVAARTLLVQFAVDYLLATRVALPVDVARVLDALTVPEQVLDACFPGYRLAGALQSTMLHYIYRLSPNQLRCSSFG